MLVDRGRQVIVKAAILVLYFFIAIPCIAMICMAMPPFALHLLNIFKWIHRWDPNRSENWKKTIFPEYTKKKLWKTIMLLPFGWFPAALYVFHLYFRRTIPMIDDTYTAIHRFYNTTDVDSTKQEDMLIGAITIDDRREQ
jgi:ABC-type proline/glycine betaine transport system permease subunit